MTGRRGEKKSDRRVFASPHSDAPLITLLTDFGTTDYFVAALKGVLLLSSPAARIVDISHSIPAQDVAAAAFTLLASYKSFPPGTIHVVVVDPGVGSPRRAIIVEAGEQIFIGPDNGSFSYIFERETAFQAFQLSDKELAPPASSTFHGRDLFAPVAALVANGTEPGELGSLISDPVRLPLLEPAHLSNGNVKARILHIDHFGNCITNLTRDTLTPQMIEAGARLTLNGKTIKSFRRFFAEEGECERLFAVWGSAGFLELAARNRSAAKILNARSGQSVLLKTGK